MKLPRLTPAVSSMPLFHPKYDGIIEWDATDKGGDIIVKVHMTEKKKREPQYFQIERIKVVTVILRGKNTDLPLNFYHPDFPSAVHFLILAHMAKSSTKKVIDEMSRM